MRFPYKSKFKNGSIMCVHEEDSIETTQKIVEVFSPDLIIELGTSWGGFTLVLHEACPSAELHSFDRPDPPRAVDRRDLFGKNVHFHNNDILLDNFAFLINLCGDDRRKLLYCDNGNKIVEALRYGGCLNNGDMIGVHDWGSEISYDKIKDLVENFIPVEQELYERMGWSTRLWKVANK